MKKRFEVTIAGEINLDLILYGLPEEMPLERELLAKDFRMTLGSSSAILAHNLAALGVSVGFITRLGDDALGSIALERLSERGVDLTAVKRVSGGTSTGVTILLNHDGKRHILTYPGTMYEMVATDLDMTYLASGRHFHLSSLFLHKALQPDLPRICRQLKAQDLTLSLDTNDDPDDQWGGALDRLLDIVDIFLPNEAEACRISGERHPMPALLSATALLPSQPSTQEAPRHSVIPAWFGIFWPAATKMATRNRAKPIIPRIQIQAKCETRWESCWEMGESCPGLESRACTPSP